GLRRSAGCAGCDSWLEEGGNGTLPRPLILLRWWRADAVLRAARRSENGRQAGPDGRHRLGGTGGPTARAPSASRTGTRQADEPGSGVERFRVGRFRVEPVNNF